MASTTAQSDHYRLPTSVTPKHYDLTIQTDLEKLTFEGFVKVKLHVNKETSTLVFNSDDLDIHSASLYCPPLKQDLALVEKSFDTEAQRALLTFAAPLPGGSDVDLRLKFKGELGSSMTGYYRSAWEDNGEKKHYALTQFEATDARRAFPCWDEPALKATYAITLISRADTVNLSNMPAVSEDIIQDGKHELFPNLSLAPGEWKVTKFETTPLVSSYLVAFSNGPFVYKETSVKMPLSGKTVPLRIYTTKDNISQAQFALDVKAKVLPLYEEVFDVEYPLPKLDTLVASDFDAGAMENWGLITGRTQAFLLDPAKADERSRKWVMVVQSHEVAHMWFGNITTMAWWDYLYLNEGFATLMGEVIIPNRVFPEYKAPSLFINDHLNSAFVDDAKLSSHPIEVACPNANDINQIFDNLSYSKAASVLRMLADYVGEERFLKGVSLYLKDHLYANSVTLDLWKGISQATGIDIVSLMDNWINKVGFPVLTVTEKDGEIVVRQDRFLDSGPAKEEDNQTIWNVPLSIVSVDKSGKVKVDKEAVLKEREATFPVDTSKNFKLNGGTTGVYRVLYTPERLAKIGAEAAKENSIFTLDDRIGLVYDSFALSKAGLAKLSATLNLVDLLRNEPEYLVWSCIADNLEGLSSTWWEYPEVQKNLKAFRRSLFVPLVKKFGYERTEGDSTDDVQLRAVAIEQAASGEDEGVIQELRSRFDKYLKTGDDSSVPADLLRVIYTTAVKYGGVEEYNLVEKIHKNPDTPSAGSAARIALGATQDPTLIARTFDTMLNGARDQDMSSLFAGVGGNRKFRREMSVFFKQEYNAFYKRFEKNSGLKRLVQYAWAYLSTEKDAQDMQEFFKGKDVSRFHLALSQTLESIRSKAAYIERSSHDLSGWLSEWASKNQTSSRLSRTRRDNCRIRQ